MDDVDENGGLTDPAESLVSDLVVSNLRGAYRKDEMQDTGTSFWFICLLHLANECGSKIEVGESPGAEGGDNTAGNLWHLKEHSSLPPFLSSLGN